MTNYPAYTPIADHALLIELAGTIDSSVNRAVLDLDRALAMVPIAGVLEVVPAYVSLLIDFDPTATDHSAVEAAVRHILQDVPRTTAPSRAHIVQGCFDADVAPDLGAVATQVDLSPERVVEVFLAGDYQVAMYGFAPGYAYLLGLHPQIQVPRKPQPVRDVPAGSIIITGPQCLITTVEMPTGWSVIGRSPTAVHRPDADQPFLFDPGDRVTFERVDRSCLGLT